MTAIRTEHKIYFFAVGFLALWVGIWGFFIPTQVQWALPWLVPPLHARFLGAMYLSGATFMVLSLLAKRWVDVRVVLPMIAIWTGLLFLISLFYLGEFDFGRPQPWIWFAAYLAYPAIALWLAWQQYKLNEKAVGTVLPSWARIYLLVQGSLMCLLGLALLIAPGFMVSVWPWAVTRLLAQIYSAPFLAYGIGSFLLARCQTWDEIRIAVTSILVFTAGALLASIIHSQLFSAADLSDWLWFIGFGLVSLMLAVLSIRAFASARA